MNREPFSNRNPEKSLSAIMETARVRLVSTQRLKRSAPWFFRTAESIPVFYAVLRGRCRIRIDESEEIFSLSRGDVGMLLHGKRHWLQSERRETGNKATSRKQSVIFRATFAWNSRVVLSEFPSVVLFPNRNGEFASWLKRFAGTISEDAAVVQPGARTVLSEMAHLLVVQSIFSVSGMWDTADSYPAAKSDSRISAF